jgi:hypothetical protein
MKLICKCGEIGPSWKPYGGTSHLKWRRGPTQWKCDRCWAETVGVHIIKLGKHTLYFKLKEASCRRSVNLRNG